jgi:hypothetical protein
MKIITIFTLSLSVVFLTSCADDEPNVRGSIAINKTSKKIIKAPIVKLSALPSEKVQAYQRPSVDILPSVGVDILQYITEIADRKRNDWINREFSIPPFALLKPIRPIHKVLVENVKKKEFETTEDYELRVAKIHNAQEEESQKLDLEYQNRLYKYNSRLNEYDLYIENEKEQRLKASKDIFTAYVKEGVDNMLGTPSIKELVYSADLESFYGTLYSKISSFNRRIVINVPIRIAQDFKDNTQYALPDIDFALKGDDTLYIEKLSIIFKGMTYPASIVRNVLSVTKSRN